ncbi:MAG TPA: heavy metal-binding domain-containing protein [Candidatus Limnocylindria bacterium]|nr:heavy metal-binding domain-containing protein [Candidatus Limnocylindria bacterium]
MLLTTTHTVQDTKVREYVGIVSGQAILGANILKDLLAGIRDVVGGRSTAYEKELTKAREIALKELEEQAKKLNANGVIGIELDYQTLGQGSMLMVTASGTAVRFATKS